MSETPARRIFAIGLDGATFDLIGPWVQAGYLPTFARLMANGTWGTLRSVVPPVTMPAWASFLTGMSPGSHGLYSFLQRKPGSYGMTPFNASYLQAPDIGTLLSEQERRVVLVNIPATYPPRPLNGVVVSGLETPGPGVTYTHPPELQAELVRRFSYEIERTEKYDPGQEALFLAAVERVERKRLEAVLWLMEEVTWDLFAVVFRGTDILGHAFWRFMDATHPAHDPALAEAYGDVLRRHYQEMDTAVARIEAKLGPDTLLMLMSDHGFGPIHRDIYIDNVLVQAGLLYMKTSPRAQLRQALFRMGLTPNNILKVLAALRLRNLTRRLVPQKRRLAISTGLLLHDSVDWSRTVAYPLGGSGQIFINLRGREPEGIVLAGKGYEEACTAVADALYTLRDPDTGQPVVARVWRKAETYGRYARPDLPDLYVQWTGDRYTDMGGIGFGKGIFSPPVRGRSGGHTMRGIFLAHGPGIRRGHHLENAELIDLAPTILHGLGALVPRQMDGRVLTEMWQPGAAGSPRYSDDISGGAEVVHEFSPAEQAVIEKRLHDLGYI